MNGFVSRRLVSAGEMMVMKGIGGIRGGPGLGLGLRPWRFTGSWAVPALSRPLSSSTRSVSLSSRSLSVSSSSWFPSRSSPSSVYWPQPSRSQSLGLSSGTRRYVPHFVQVNSHVPIHPMPSAAIHPIHGHSSTNASLRRFRLRGCRVKRSGLAGCTMMLPTNSFQFPRSHLSCLLPREQLALSCPAPSPSLFFLAHSFPALLLQPHH